MTSRHPPRSGNSPRRSGRWPWSAATPGAAARGRAAEHLIGALRCLYRHAVADGLIAAERNPAIAVAKPRRLASTRRALPDECLVEINQVAASTGNDPDLDMLLLRLHTETACRRGGALTHAIRPIWTSTSASSG